MDKNSNEFESLKKYVENTHAATHNLFALEIEDIFKVNRKGENHLRSYPIENCFGMAQEQPIMLVFCHR